MALRDTRSSWALFWLLMGRTVSVLGLFLLVPFLAALVWQEPEARVFPVPAGCALLCGAAMMRLGHAPMRQLTVREGAFFMVLVWPVLGLIGLMPYHSAGVLPDFSAAFFESISSLTTTGLSCLEFDRMQLPQSLLLWHALMSWLGGLVFVMILATVLPQVSGCFGLTLSARQTIFFSPVWNRMNQSLKQGGGVYAGLTLLAALLYYLAGLSPFEAGMRGMLTLSSSGGSSPEAYMPYHNGWLELAAGLAMFLSGLNLLLCWKVWHSKNFYMLWQDTELRGFLVILLAAGAMLSFHLYVTNYYDLAESLRYGYFQAVSFLSTNGFASANFWLWQDFDRYILFLLVFVGGCIGSAGGGLKVMRLMVLLRMTRAEIHRTLHPHMVVSVKMDGLPVPDKIVARILAFFFLYVLMFAVFSMLLSITGLGLIPSMGIAAGCLTSTGSTAALFGMNSLYFLPDWAKILCSLLMIIGRIEVFSFFILLDLGVQALHKKW